MLFTVPSRYCPLSVSREYLALPDGPGRFAQDYSCPALLRIPLCLILLHVRGSHPLWPLFPKTFHSQSEYNRVVLQPRHCVATTPVWALPRSLATTGGIIQLFSLPRGTKMFQFPRFALPTSGNNCLVTVGLSHSEIFGSKAICTYPKLIAAYHVLHRLHEPRHPPYALNYFLISPCINTQIRINRNHARCMLLILSAVLFSLPAFLLRHARKLILSYKTQFTLQFCLCQYVKERVVVFIMHQQDAQKRNQVWRITDSNR